MTLLDPKERTERGIASQTELTGRPSPEPKSLFQSSWRDYVFAEVWNRPGLERRARFLIATSSAAMGDCSDAILDDYMRGALTTGELTLSELREASLHVAVYSGWGHGDRFDKSVDRVAQELDLVPCDYPALRAEPWDKEQRYRDGQAEFQHVMTFPGPTPEIPYHEGGILNFVFGEMWCRAGLDQRSRRWITLVGVCDAGVDIPIQTHIYAAMKSGNCQRREMLEFVLQYALHAGWPKASALSSIVNVMADKVENGLPFSPM